MTSIALAPGRVSMSARDAPRPQTWRQDAKKGGPDARTRPPTIDLFPAWSGTSGQARAVRLALECNRDPGAAPFYTVSYDRRPTGRFRIVRHTPAPERALELLAWFLLEVTEPERLRPSRSPSRPNGVTACCSTSPDSGAFPFAWYLDDSRR